MHNVGCWILAGFVLAVAGWGRAEDEPWVFAVAGDSRSDVPSLPVNTNILGEIARALAAEAPELVLFSGDLVYGPPATEAALRLWKSTMAPVYDAGIRVYPIRGNHDIGSGWTNVFAELPTNGPANALRYTYAVTNRNALFLALDVYGTVYNKVDQNWVDSQLASNRLPHVFVTAHSPAFKLQHTDCLGAYPADRDRFWLSLTRAGARVYFCGHDHFYDHARIDDRDGNPVNDLRQFIVGTAGAPLRDYAGGYDGNNGSWTPVRLLHETQFGYQVVRVDGPRVTVTWKRRVAANLFVAAETYRYNAARSVALTRYVAPAGAHRAPYTNWVAAATNLQAAVDAADDGDTVLVTNGTYATGPVTLQAGVPCRLALSGAVTVRSVNGAAATRIVGGGQAGANAVRCAYVGQGGRLIGFMLTNGCTRADGDELTAQSGGGVWCAAGGVVSNCVIAGNAAGSTGGGATLAPLAVLADSEVTGNTAQHGGGVFCAAGGLVRHCTIAGNAASGTLFGGGGGVFCYKGGTVVNSILYHNSAANGTNWFFSTSGAIQYSCTTPLPEATCLTADPRFVDVRGRDFRLAAQSPCIDRAAAAWATGRDLDGLPRPLDGDANGSVAADLGAHECLNPVSDSDADGLLDAAELNVWGTDPRRGDSDGDSAPDGNEVGAGTDPLNAQDWFRILAVGVETNATGVVVDWSAVPGRFYRVFGTTNLVSGAWSNLYETTATGARLRYTNDAASPARAFRVRVWPALP